MRTVRVHSIGEMREFAKTVCHSLVPGGDACVLALSGDLGSGKTTFVQFLAAELGVTEHVTSPTFVIQKTYPLSGQKFRELVHIDAYRLEKAEELQVLGLKSLLKKPETLVCIEWPERVAGAVPKDAQNISFVFVDDTTREITA